MSHAILISLSEPLYPALNAVREGEGSESRFALTRPGLSYRRTSQWCGMEEKMKAKLQKLQEAGFTLVELMVVVAIIGVLSAIAVPNFKKYQAKAKTAEAKLQLSAAYTAEQSFYSDYDTYHNCLSYMGYNPVDEAAQRYYTVGITASANSTISAVALQNGVDATACPAAAAAARSWFAATKSIGSTSQTGTVDTTTALTEDTFLIGASGAIDDAFAAAGTSSAFNIDENKKIIQVRAGY